jgi:hypothetical protein
MTCPTCQACAPTTLAQLQHRERQAKAHPEVRFYKCTGCGTVDWALTRAFLTDAPTEYRPDGTFAESVVRFMNEPWWRRLWKWVRTRAS